MEQQFQLKMHGNMSIFEQNQMTAEDRRWWIERLKKHFDEINKNSGKNS